MINWLTQTSMVNWAAILISLGGGILISFLSGIFVWYLVDYKNRNNNRIKIFNDVIQSDKERSISFIKIFNNRNIDLSNGYLCLCLSKYSFESIQLLINHCSSLLKTSIDYFITSKYYNDRIRSINEQPYSYILCEMLNMHKFSNIIAGNYGLGQLEITPDIFKTLNDIYNNFDNIDSKYLLLRDKNTGHIICKIDNIDIKKFINTIINASLIDN